MVINPSSGPGAGKLPDSRYQAQLKKLNKFPNVESLGYVRTGYGTRTIADVASDINKYAGWSATQGLGMEGIFFDESPYNYSAANVDFMQAANQAVINATGLLGDKKVSDYHCSLLAHGLQQSNITDLDRSQSRHIHRRSPQPYDHRFYHCI